MFTVRYKNLCKACIVCCGGVDVLTSVVLYREGERAEAAVDDFRPGYLLLWDAGTHLM